MKISAKIYIIHLFYNKKQHFCCLCYRCEWRFGPLRLSNLWNLPFSKAGPRNAAFRISSNRIIRLASAKRIASLRPIAFLHLSQRTTFFSVLNCLAPRPLFLTSRALAAEENIAPIASTSNVLLTNDFIVLSS